MRIRLLLTHVTAAVWFSSLALGSPDPSPSAKAETPPNMEAFMVVLLVRPPDVPAIDAARAEQLQKDHIANIERLHQEGKLRKAGPFEDYSGRNVRGMFILKTDSLEIAREWVGSDPLIKLGRLKAEYLKWYVLKGSLD